MKSIIKHKQLYYLFLTLHVLFLSMPVSHAGDIVLCYSDTGQIDIVLKLSEECSCCSKSCENSQEKDPCFCMDIPISKEVEQLSTLLSNGDIQAKPLVSPCSISANSINTSPNDGLLSLANYSYLNNPVHQSLHSTVLLI
jgi:hypothetical protein